MVVNERPQVRRRSVELPLFERLPKRSAPGRKRRPGFWLGVIVGLAAAVIAGAAAVGVHAVWSYQPLSYGSESGDAVWLPDGTYASHEVGTDQVWNAPSTWFTAGIIVAISNRGHHGVTVDHLEFPSWGTHDQALLQPATGASWSGGTKFHPFHLSPHREQLVTLKFRVSCADIAANSYVTFSTIPVGYEFLGVHHITTLSLLQPLTIKGPSSCSAS